MKFRNAPRKSKRLLTIYLTFFLLLSIPLVTWGVVTGSFDLRNLAFDDLVVSDENPCIISLPNVNPYTLEVGQSITVQVDAQLKDSGIAELRIVDSKGNSIYTKTYDDAPITLATSFKFTPMASGMVDMLGLIKKVGGGSVACKISSAYDVLGLKALANNSAPEFTTVPAGSKPSQDITTGTTYEYTIQAKDVDGDRINYSYSFTKGNAWLKPTVIEDGSNGNLTIKFQGSTDIAGSYLANVFIHDGYSKHLDSQAWVISVSPSQNDVPLVRIITPYTATSVNQGSPISISWEASDLNLITKYSIYMAENPADEDSWIPVNANISAQTNSFLINTSNIPAGTYKIIVKAADNQTPALTGAAISSLVTVVGSSNPNSEDDVVVIAAPQVTNMTPTTSDTIFNKQVTIKATLIAGTNAKIKDDTVVIKLDDKDITDKVSINKISETEHTVIYQTGEDLTVGLHKVEATFMDTNEKTVDKSWTFTILQDDSQTTEGYVKLFGYQISQRTLIIIGAGILVVILAIVAPIIIFSVWKEEQKKKDSEPEDKGYIPNLPSEPLPTADVSINDVKNLVQTEPEIKEEKPKDVWDNYAAPAPVAETPKETVVIPEPPVEIPTPIAEIVPEPVLETPPARVVEPEVIQPTTPEVVEEKTSTPTPEPVIVEPVKAEEPPMPTPPEPDLSQDLDQTDELMSIYEQIQQSNQEETPKNSQ